MTQAELAYNICLFGPPGVEKTHLVIFLAVEDLDKGYLVAFETIENLIKIL